MVWIPQKTVQKLTPHTSNKRRIGDEAEVAVTVLVR